MRVPVAIAVVVCVLLAACESTPAPLALEHSTRVAVKRVWLAPLGVPERAEVSIMNPIGAGFGVIGTLIETRRAAAANAEMADILSKAHYDFATALTDAIALGVRKAGFTVNRADAPRSEKERGRFLSQYPKRAQVDAYLDIYVRYVGFQALQSSAVYRPRLEVVARLVSTRGDVLFQHLIVYGSATEDEDAIVIPADDNLSFRDRAALQANPLKTARALQTAIESLSWELAKEFM